MSNATIADLGEWGALKRIAQRLARQSADPRVVVDVGDDAAVVTGTNGFLVLTCDAMVEDVHFRFGWSAPEDVGYKAIASNLSDIAAMGGIPDYALITLALPAMLDLAVFDALFDGMLECAGCYSLRLVGGDLVRADRVMLSVTVTGRIREGAPWTLNGARPGDFLFVSGPLGLAEAALRLWEAGIEPPDDLATSHRRPQPRLDLVPALHRAEPRAVTDTSDGLARDLRKLCRASHVGVEIDLEKVPSTASACKAAGMLGLDLAVLTLTGGEDYELLFALGPGVEPPPGCTPIGVFTDGAGIQVCCGGKPVPLPADGYDHFGR